MLTYNRTIHGMVYNAMKLFMEVNPQLFDDCSHAYTESQNNADARKQERQAKWDKLSALAKSMQNGVAPPKIISHTSQGIQGPPRVVSPNRLTEAESNNAAMLSNLKLADETPMQAAASPVR